MAAKDPPPPLNCKKTPLGKSRVERTAFSDQNYFFKIEYISNFFHMNDIFLLIYQVLDKMRLVGYIDLTFKVLVKKGR